MDLILSAMRWVEHMSDKSPIILALDQPDVESVRALIERTQNSISIFKLGLEFYLAQGSTGIRTIIDEFPEIDIFLDLKLHDIPIPLPVRHRASRT